jgi:tRNA(Ile)-lysidine synthase
MIGSAVRQFLAAAGISPCRIVAAVSGGADSTALLLALHELGEYEVVCAHVNHHLRGAESDADEVFVRDLCARLGVAVHVADGTLDDAAVRDRGIEAAAREVRYARLQEVRERTGARFVATAHQKNDQAETVLMRALTGSGIAGLRGIRAQREDGFIRPLLAVTREEIEVFLRKRSIEPRIDRSNDDPRFLRNRVRAFLRELHATDNLANIAAQMRAIEPILERAIDAQPVEVTSDETRLWLQGAALQRHVAGARVSISRHLELLTEQNAIVLRRRREAPQPFAVPLTPETPAKLAGMTMHLGPPTTDNRQRIQLPSGATPAFLVRSRKPGDRFHPLGLPHTKKLKDFLIDRKIPSAVRDRLPLLVFEGEIVWIPEVEVSEKYKVTSPAHGDIYEVWIERC